MDHMVLSDIVLYGVLATHKINAKTGLLTQRKNRPCWALAIKTGGSTEYVCNRKRITSNPQSVVLLPKGIDYTWISYGGECIMVEFACNIEWGDIIRFPLADNKGIAELAEKIEHIRAKSDSLSELKSIELLYKIFVILLASEMHYTPSAKAKLIGRSVDYIHENYADPRITLGYLAGISEMSEIYFRKIFTSVYGVPPMKYVAMLRMNKAKEILESDYNSVETVAASVGYSSVYHFSKMFKQYFGIAPSKLNQSEAGLR